jgi:hypothetical protein
LPACLSWPVLCLDQERFLSNRQHAGKQCIVRGPWGIVPLGAGRPWANCGTILFRAEVWEVIRAEGPAVHPAKGGALVYRPHRMFYSAVSCGGRPNGPRVRLIAPPGGTMPQSLARTTLHITFSSKGRRAYLPRPDVREATFRMLRHHSQDELLARWAERYREQEGIFVGPLYQGFALRWVNRRPFGAHICRREGDLIGLGLVDQYVSRLPKTQPIGVGRTGYPAPPPSEP